MKVCSTFFIVLAALLGFTGPLSAAATCSTNLSGCSCSSLGATLIDDNRTNIIACIATTSSPSAKDCTQTACTWKALSYPTGDNYNQVSIAGDTSLKDGTQKTLNVGNGAGTATVCLNDICAGANGGGLVPTKDCSGAGMALQYTKAGGWSCVDTASSGALCGLGVMMHENVAGVYGSLSSNKYFGPSSPGADLSCQGYDPSTQCPSGYTQTVVVTFAGSSLAGMDNTTNYVVTCVKQ